VALATHEVQVEIRNTLRAVMSLGLGIGIAAIDGWLLIPMVVHLCHARAALPLWACDGIVGGLCAVGGIRLLVPGKQQLARMPLVPQATVETMKENMQWIKDQARTNGPSWSTT
jgi:hypothetical protein